MYSYALKKDLMVDLRIQEIENESWKIYKSGLKGQESYMQF